MSRIRALYVVVVLAAGTGVAWAQSVHTDLDRSVNLGSFQTYYWGKAEPVPGNDIVNTRIINAVDAGMARRGWMKAPEGQADLMVVAHVTTRERQRIENFYTGWGGGWGWGGWGPATTTVQSYLEGTLIVDIFDAMTMKLVWRGTATDTISDNPDKNAEHINDGVAKMFGKKFYPDID